MRLVILCEGPCDRDILKILLERLGLQEMAFHILPIAEIFGLCNKRRIRAYVCNWLKDPNTLAVFQLVDLKGARINYPNAASSYQDKANHVKVHLKSSLNGLPFCDRYYAHVAVHDIEAWILADKYTVSKYLNMTSHVYPADLPETLNFDKPPKYILKELFRRYKGIAYRPSVHGPELFSLVDLEIVYKKCAYFKAFVDEIKTVTQEAINGN